MNTLAWLDDESPLPSPDNALPDGLLAAGGSLSIKRLTEAYSMGVFPWFNEGDPVLWWSPNPRMVLTCAEFKPSHSLQKKLRQLARREQYAGARIQIKMDTAFDDVIKACAGPRTTQHGTWITPAVQAAYCAWHAAGHVHSVETWVDGRLMGGLYGVSLGRFFFGESMFSHATDASKLALAYLVGFLIKNQVQHIDCQQQTSHLASMGAHPISRDCFLNYLEQALKQPAPLWGKGQLFQSGVLASDGSKTP